MRRRRLGFGYRLAVVILKPILTLLVRRDWRGTRNLPASGGFVVTPNHTSSIDAFMVAHLLYDNGRPPRFLGKESIFRMPCVGRLLHGAGQIPVYRETSDAQYALHAAIDAVRAGECVVIYPEATLTRDRALWPMAGKTGAAPVALATGCPVIPPEVLRGATDAIMDAITGELEPLRGEQAPATRLDARAEGLPPTGRHSPEAS